MKAYTTFDEDLETARLTLDATMGFYLTQTEGILRPP